jgi:hypothetical protein
MVSVLDNARRCHGDGLMLIGELCASSPSRGPAVLLWIEVDVSVSSVLVDDTKSFLVTLPKPLQISFISCTSGIELFRRYRRLLLVACRYEGTTAVFGLILNSSSRSPYANPR